MRVTLTALTAAATAVGVGLAAGSAAAEGDVNIYSARHYQTDEALYEEFTERTGIDVNRIQGKSDALIQRIKSEGRNTPADILITVDAGRLWRAEEAGILESVSSDTLESRVPAHFRHPDGKWFGYSTRARIIFYDAQRYDAPPATAYEDLADPVLKGEVCIRSSSNVYNQSLLASMIEHHGAEEAETWARGVVENFAREPEGGDTDQILGVAAGECGVAVANHYYYLRVMEERPELSESIGVVFPNQDGRGVHVNISGAGKIANGPNPENAVRFLEFLASDFAQRRFADGNNEYPVVEGVAPNTKLKDFGEFKVDNVNVAVYGENQPEAQMIFDRVGWK
ncbi:Fe(3+) ABC transporter substrate-binding protein [Ferruginivarius sediminum]|uniref:Iron ABC transporter substrate-binding protein n=1 Tax=Ferruginivarius sediminum TaxID=2661937 RepID=A0A369T8S4_9PROT|nr:Fe(3+) ABC transporter substrate-binding protein [Ferruginivarius sediminum]RDD60874.1 iron ABC transporter substrate-binding protein [Ferruginivarius sediminum]